ncbi:MAG: tRNA (adenosine(37)-N6)-threonylcarbamoyltransferase complex dimerization subunit type 1 TsaB [Gemmatimonadota bacterium]
MLTLALETSTPLASVALGDGPTLLAESLLPVRVTHSESVLPEIDRILHGCGKRPHEVEAVVVGAGPGSFTGVRIAASLGKGLCFAHKVALYAYSSLTAIAAGVGVQGRVCALLDARRGQVYAAGYLGGEELRRLFGPTVSRVEELLGSLFPVDEWRFAGGGATRHAESIRAAGGTVLPPHLGVPRAAALLWLVRSSPESGLVTNVANWEPEYVRLSSAEREVGARWR